MNWGYHRPLGPRALKRGRRRRQRMRKKWVRRLRLSGFWRMMQILFKARKREGKKGRGWWDPRHSLVSPSLKRKRFRERRDERCLLWNRHTVLVYTQRSAVTLTHLRTARSVTVGDCHSIHSVLLYERSIGDCKNCHSKRLSLYPPTTVFAWW